MKKSKLSLAALIYLHSNLVIFKSVISMLYKFGVALFTFQSGDIQIKYTFDELIGYIANLHSNLVIFKSLTLAIPNPLSLTFTFQSGDIQIIFPALLSTYH